MRTMKLSLVIAIAFLTCSSRAIIINAASELFTLFVTQNGMIRTLKHYLNLEQDRIRKLQWHLHEHENLMDVATSNIEDFHSDPLNAYLVIKRVTVDWEKALKLIEKSDDPIHIENMLGLKYFITANHEDFVGAASALLAIQRIYDLDTKDLANGQILDSEPWLEMTASDCYELGKKAVAERDYNYAAQWFEESLDRLEDDEEMGPNYEAHVLEHLSYANYMIGNVEAAIEITRNLLKIDPENSDAWENLKMYQDEFLSNGDETSNRVSKDSEGNTTEYQKLCRGEELKTNENTNSLACRHAPVRHPFLALQNVKEEAIYQDPRIVLYHDFLSDYDISLLKYLGKQEMANSSEESSSEIPNSKSGWLGSQHEVVARVKRRIMDMTGLKLDKEEKIQITNYGLSGHRDPDQSATSSNQYGDVTATWTVYMSDVYGGATVFPDTGISIAPIKGTAILWYNLLSNGSLSQTTVHAECPVLGGSKWVMRIWIRKEWQEM